MKQKGTRQKGQGDGTLIGEGNQPYSPSLTPHTHTHTNESKIFIRQNETDDASLNITVTGGEDVHEFTMA